MLDTAAASLPVSTRVPRVAHSVNSFYMFHSQHEGVHDHNLFKNNSSLQALAYVRPGEENWVQDGTEKVRKEGCYPIEWFHAFGEVPKMLTKRSKSCLSCVSDSSDRLFPLYRCQSRLVFCQFC